jgi:hypothetical protein
MRSRGQDAIRTHVLELLHMKGAHADFAKATAGLPAELRGTRPAGAPHSPWELVEHLRLAQFDILEFVRNPKYKEPRWPDDYWPSSPGPRDEEEWQESLDCFYQNAAELEALVADPRCDLFAQIPHGSGQTLLREALLVADHNAYHLGQLILVRRLLGAWE